MGYLVHIPRPRVERDGGRSLARCPACESALVQPQGWKELPNGDLMLQLRCPDCMIVIAGSFAADQVARFDAELVRGRAQVERAYRAIVRENMSELSVCFSRALELDLIGPDDFRSSQSGRGLQSSRDPISRRR